MSLDDLLAALSGCDEPELRRVFSHPWIWPRDAGEADGLSARGLAEPATPAPGRTLLVSVSDTAARRTLWALGLGTTERTVPFGRDAESARLIAERLVLRDLPVLPDARRALRPDAWRALAIHVDGPGADRALDGDSFGASFLLAAASIALGRGVGARFAASARLLPDGTMGPVGRIGEKAQLVARCALGVDTFYVHSSDVDLARRGISNDRVRVVGVTSARELLELVFPGFDAIHSLPAPWRGMDAARAAAEHLFSVAVGRGTSLFASKPLARLADLLVVHLGSDPLAGRAAFARQVFARHAAIDAPLTPLTDAEASSLPEPLRLAVTAHVVQAAADTWDGIDDALALGAANLPVRLTACHADHLKLRGAMGRAFAHAKRYPTAADWLEETVDAWFRLLLPAEASYALCELARVRGILRDAPGLERAEALVERAAADPAMSLDSLGFMALALGRAWTLSGQPGRGLARLDESSLGAEVTRADVQATRHRWKAIALEALGLSEQARQERASFEEARAKDGGMEPLDAAMLALERTVGSGADPMPAVERVRAARPRMVQVLGAGLDGSALAECLVREYPY